MFPRIQFKNATVVATAPGERRFYVAEQTGKVYSIPDSGDPARAELFLDPAELVARLRQQTREEIELEAVYGMAFHPRFQQNRYCYLCYVVRYIDQARGQHPTGTRVVRLRVDQGNPPRCEPASEQLVIAWLQGGHNGGCLKFGREGYLYISTGDGGGAFPPDPLNAGQDVGNLLSAILRIDVDHAGAETAYAIPADNPFVGLAGARAEIWAYGLRNPWKMSFDRATGDLWVGDVGWELWELVFKVQKGDNYGWSLYEGRQPVHANRLRGPTPIVAPTVEIPHTDGVSVTGGFVYRGRKFPELVGTYLFGDWETRRIWGVNAQKPQAHPKVDLVTPTVRVVDFAEDHDGEIYLLDYDEGTLHALQRNDAPVADAPFPRALSQTGIFEETAAHRVAPGVLPFQIHAEVWADGATAERFIAVPGDGIIQLANRPRAIAGSMFQRSVEYPADTLLVKTLSLDLQPGNPATRRRIETQVLHFDGRDWRGYTYEWNDAQTDALLVEAQGKNRPLIISDPAAPGGKRRQTWRFAARTDCLRCHNPWSETALAFNIPQLNRQVALGNQSINQIVALRQMGLVQEVEVGPEPEFALAPAARPRSVESLPRLVDPFDASEALDRRARAYLHVNCAHCHKNGGGGSAYVHLPFDLPLSETKALGVRPSQGTFGIADVRIVAPGDPYRSVLYFRMAKLGAGHMPHLGSNVVDARGLELIHEWIRQLPARYDDALAIERLAAAHSAPLAERQRVIDALLATPSSAVALFRALQLGRLPQSAKELVVAAAGKHADAAVRDLFESFVPEEQRAQRLGDSIKPQEILDLSGDVERGRRLFHSTAGVQCRNCHKIGDDGAEVGPNLGKIGGKLTRVKLLESLLEPSKSIEPEYVTYVVETTAGAVRTGLLVRKDEAGITLKDAENKIWKIPAGEIEAVTTQQKSIMPDLLLRDMTAQQVADLLAYLESLK